MRSTPALRAFFSGAVLACTVASVYGHAAEPGDAPRGRLLYQNHCQFCHTPQVHSRPKPLAVTRDELRVIVKRFSAQQGLGWSDEDTEDVVEYLNDLGYRFPRR
jgi:mono/diheme cytochrome c family protein